MNRLENPILPLELGKSRLIYSKHTFLHYIDLEYLVKQLESIERHFSFIKEHVNYSTNSSGIGITTYRELQENFMSRTEYLIQITTDKLQNMYPHVRKERGLINVVSKVSKWLFGTLDAEDGERYDKAINELRVNRKNIDTELKLQISLSQRLIDNYNKTISQLSANQQTLQKSLRALQLAISENINNMHDYLNFQGILLQLNLDCQNMIMFLDNLEDAITFSKVNALHNSVVSNSELKSMLSYLTSLYGKEKLPNFKNILSYYQYLGIQVTFSRDKIIFAIHAPILNPNTLSFYQLFPTVQNQSILLPNYPYMVQEGTVRQFVAKPCPAIEDTFYCLEKFHSRDQCLENILDNLPIDSCVIAKIHVDEPIIEEISRGLILVLPTKPVGIKTKCQTDQHLKVYQSTLLSIPETCEALINNKLFVNDARVQKGKPLILPAMQLPTFSDGTSQIFETPHLSKIQFDEINDLKRMANQLKSIDDASEPSSFDQPTFWVPIVLCILVAMVLIITQKEKILRILRKSKKQSNDQSIDPSKTQSVLFEA